MPMTLNRTAFVQLLNEDLEWLKRQPRTLERDHIEQSLEFLKMFSPRELDELHKTKVAAKTEGS